MVIKQDAVKIINQFKAPTKANSITAPSETTTAKLGTCCLLSWINLLFAPFHHRLSRPDAYNIRLIYMVPASSAVNSEIRRQKFTNLAAPIPNDCCITSITGVGD